MTTTSPDLTYVRPSTLAEALSELARLGSAAKLIAGGTDLMLLIQEGEAAPEYVVDIRSIPELRRFEYSDDAGLTLGAAVTLRSLETSPVVRRHYPQLAESAAEIGSVQIRTLGTVGGNLCNSMPSADLAPALICLGATIRIVSDSGEHEIPVEDLFSGPRQTILETDDVLVDLHLPAPAPRTGGVYLRMSNSPSMDITFAGVAATVSLSPEGPAEEATIGSARIALAAVAPTPIRAREAEALLVGRRPDSALLEECGRLAADASRPITDLRASAEYRREMVAVLTGRAVAASVERARAAGLVR